MKLHLDRNIIEGTPEELVEYLRLVGGNSSDNQLTTYGHAHQPDEECTEPTEESEDESQDPSTELQVGDKVRVLESACGAEGEATVTAILKNGFVEIAGKDKDGDYLTNWSSHELLLEKIEEEEDVEVDPEEVEGLLGYRYWYLDGTNFNTFVVLKARANYFEDSTGKRYTYQAVSEHVKPVDREDVRVKFECAKDNGKLLMYYSTVDLFTHK